MVAIRLRPLAGRASQPRFHFLSQEAVKEDMRVLTQQHPAVPCVIVGSRNSRPRREDAASLVSI